MIPSHESALAATLATQCAITTAPATHAHPSTAELPRALRSANAQRVHNTISSVSERDMREGGGAMGEAHLRAQPNSSHGAIIAVSHADARKSIHACVVCDARWPGDGVDGGWGSIAFFFHLATNVCAWPSVENSVRASGRIWVDGGGLVTRDKYRSVPAFCAPHASADLHVAYQPCPPPTKDTLPLPRWLHRVSSRRACVFSLRVCVG
jgi:hypothetical protein